MQNYQTRSRSCTPTFSGGPAQLSLCLPALSSLDVFQSTLRCLCFTAQELLIEHLAARSVVHTNKAQREELNYKDVGEIWLARLPSLRNVSTSMGVTVVCAKLHTHSLTNSPCHRTIPCCRRGEQHREALSSHNSARAKPRCHTQAACSGTPPQICAKPCSSSQPSQVGWNACRA